MAGHHTYDTVTLHGFIKQPWDNPLSKFMKRCDTILPNTTANLLIKLTLRVLTATKVTVTYYVTTYLKEMNMSSRQQICLMIGLRKLF